MQSWKIIDVADFYRPNSSVLDIGFVGLYDDLPRVEASQIVEFLKRYPITELVIHYPIGNEEFIKLAKQISENITRLELCLFSHKSLPTEHPLQTIDSVGYK